MTKKIQPTWDTNGGLNIFGPRRAKAAINYPNYKSDPSLS